MDRFSEKHSKYDECKIQAIFGCFVWVFIFQFMSCMNKDSMFSEFVVCSSSFQVISGPMLSICVSVCLSVSSLLRYCFTVFLPPLPKVGCPKCLEIRNTGGKVMERGSLRLKKKILLINCVKSPRQKKSFLQIF